MEITFSVYDFKAGIRSMKWFGGTYNPTAKTWAFSGQAAEKVWEYLDKQGGISDTGNVQTCALSSRLEGVRLISAEQAIA